MAIALRADRGGIRLRDALTDSLSSSVYLFVAGLIIESVLTVPRIAGIPGPYWLFFYSFDCAEPMHVHIRRERNQAKF